MKYTNSTLLWDHQPCAYNTACASNVLNKNSLIASSTNRTGINSYNSWLLPHITIQPLQQHDASICTDQYCIRPSAMLRLGQVVE